MYFIFLIKTHAIVHKYILNCSFVQFSLAQSFYDTFCLCNLLCNYILIILFMLHIHTYRHTDIHTMRIILCIMCYYILIQMRVFYFYVFVNVFTRNAPKFSSNYFNVFYFLILFYKTLIQFYIYAF